MENVKERFLSSEYGYGYGYGSFFQNLDGSGAGSGCGDGSWSGSGYGDGDEIDIKSFCGKTVYIIAGVPTLLDTIQSNCIAKGRILRADLTTEECVVVKKGEHFAHGKTLREAMDAAHRKALG